MKRILFICSILLASSELYAQNEIGPDGDKLVYVFLFIALLIAVFLITGKKRSKVDKKASRGVGFRKIDVQVEKDALYYPDKLTLTVTNKGGQDVDLDKPLLVFDNFWMKRKFRLKGMNQYNFYPLYLEKGKTHTLQIDLTQFYGHDKSLKKFPKSKVVVFDVKGKRLGSSSVYLRKTLFRF